MRNNAFTWKAKEESEIVGGISFVTYRLYVCYLNGSPVGDVEDGIDGKYYADVTGGDNGKFRTLEDAQAFIEASV